MRIWSLHPSYLDSKGLVALWRETLLAKNVLEGKTKGYRNHPQLNRFKEAKEPIDAINFYLHSVWEEAKSRDYRFDERKFQKINDVEQIIVTTGQLDFEKNHLLKKLLVRDLKRYNAYKSLLDFGVHPLFNPINGEIESWERI